MKRILLILTVLGAMLPSLSAIDFAQLEVDVTMNPSEYKGLLDRFVAGDTTLTVPEVQKVYYGFAFTPSYEPRDTFPAIREAYKRKDFVEVGRLVGEALELNPVSLDLSLMARAAYESGEIPMSGVKALNMSNRTRMLTSAILKSGQGTMARSPFCVTSSKDRDRLLHDIIVVGPILGKDHVGEIEAYKFNFPGHSRMHILYFDNTLEEKFLKSHR